MGRKNHGVRKARWLKMQQRAKRRWRKWWHSQRDSWHYAHRPHMRVMYLRSQPAYRPRRLMLPYWMYVKDPKKWIPEHPGYPRGHAFFIGGGNTNPHTKVVWTFPGLPHAYPFLYTIWFVRRRVTHFGKRVHKMNAEEVMEWSAYRWWRSTYRESRYPGNNFDVGWPIWDPRQRHPQQIVWGHNIP